MAGVRWLPTVALVFFSIICVTQGKQLLECEDLPADDCAFSVSASGTRCVLEKYMEEDLPRIECQSSIIMAEKQEAWIESDECMEACGLERLSFGLSTDFLLDSRFTGMLCSSKCVDNCPNILDLYTSLAAGEGFYLPQLCTAHKLSSRRLIAGGGESMPRPGEALPPIESSIGNWAGGSTYRNGEPTYTWPSNGEQGGVQPPYAAGELNSGYVYPLDDNP